MTGPAVLLVGYGPTTPSALASLLPCTRVVGLVREVEETADAALLALARANGVALLGGATASRLAALVDEVRPDWVVVSSYNRILPPSLIERSRFINVHYSPLPGYRGRANVNWAIINGEAEAAISIHMIDDGLDSGDILFQQRIPIGASDTAADLYGRLNAIQERELGRAVAAAHQGFAGMPQDGADASYCCGRVASDGLLDWSRPAEDLARLIRALAPPFPPAFTWHKSRRIDVLEAEAVADRYVGRVPGRVTGVDRAQGTVDVLAGSGTLRIRTIRVADGPVTDAASVVRSTRDTLGLDMTELLDRLDKLERQVAELKGLKDDG